MMSRRRTEIWLRLSNSMFVSLIPDDTLGISDAVTSFILSSLYLRGFHRSSPDYLQLNIKLCVFFFSVATICNEYL